MTLPVVDLFLSVSHRDVAAVLGGLETQSWCPIDTLVRFGLCGCTRGVQGGVLLHGGTPIGATHT